MLKSCEVFFVYTLLNMVNLIPFTKRFESSENLVNLLESRGLQICDRNKAIQYLDNIGYYRLSAYMYPLLKMPKTAHLYKEGSTFEKVMMLYHFDKKLRLLMFNEIEKIEIAWITFISWLWVVGFGVRFALLIEKSSIRKGDLTKNQ